MWLELLNKIRNAFEESGFAGDVKLGFLNPQNAGITEKGMVFLGRGECSPMDGLTHNMLKQEFFVEVWARCDEADFKEAYAVIAALEEIVEQILSDFRNACGQVDEKSCVLKNSGYQIIDIQCVNKMDDHDSMRPFIGTQYQFEARVQDLSQGTQGGIY